jgi:hypothetical protein
MFWFAQKMCNQGGCPAQSQRGAAKFTRAGLYIMQGLIKATIPDQGLSRSNGLRKWLTGKESTGSPTGKRACIISTKITGLFISNKPQKNITKTVSLNPKTIKFISQLKFIPKYLQNKIICNIKIFLLQDG